MGGTAGKDQRVYFINLKEIFDNKFGSATPMAYNDPTYRAIYIRYLALIRSRSKTLSFSIPTSVEILVMFIQKLI